MNELRKTFENPGSQYRGKPFWAWNGKLDAEELRRQIRVMKRMGLGGFFMHSRVGLATPYLSEEWFDMVKACVDESEKIDMEAWMYDEDRWPSGAAGGLVTCNPKYRMRRLALSILPRFPQWTPDTVAIFLATFSGGMLSKYRRLRKGEAPGKLSSRTKVLWFREVLEEPSSWFNRYTYLDTMNPEAVREFIKVTHQSYAKHIGKHFGGRVPGIFTDEPHRGSLLGISVREGMDCIQNPWTGRLPAEFRKRYGYDLLDFLPEIFIDVKGQPVSKARYHYQNLITALFVEAFAKQIWEWCEKNGVQHTGHILAEGDLISQSSVVGSTMRFYEYMQAPGIDILTEYNYEYDTAKQCSSVLEQMGRKWMLSELYGCTGWDFPFEGHKAIGDWQSALGVNLRCHHLYWFTMLGDAKRDYPASIGHQSPWWEVYSKVEDYFARVNSVLVRGKAIRDVLVLHPIETTWCRAGVTLSGERVEKSLINKPEALEDVKRMQKIRNWLLEAHIDFDYGDEEIMSRLSKVDKTPDGALLSVGKACYRAVVVPPMLTIRSTTLELLRQFASAGGAVVFAGGVPEFVDAEPSALAKEVASQCRTVGFRKSSILKVIEPVARKVSITDQNGEEIPSVLYMLRRDGKTHYLFLCNTDRKKGFEEVTIVARVQGHPEDWDPETGEVYRADYKGSNEAVTIKTSLPPSGSRLFVIPPEKTPALRKRPVYIEVRGRKFRRKPWDVQLTEPNVVVLDMPRFKIGDAEISGPEEILKVDRLVRGALGVEERSGRMVQPWARKKTTDMTVPVCLLYTFKVRALPRSGLYLALETPHRFTIRVNRYLINPDTDCGWWTDSSLRKLPIPPAYLKEGTNRLELSIHYGEEDGLEIVYLLGDFGVKHEGITSIIIDPVRSLRLGDWTRQGLPFYGGSVVYRTTVPYEKRSGERVFLELPGWRGACVRVFVNAKYAGVLAWEPLELDITSCLRGNKGKVEVALEVFGSRRNSHGPLHLRDPHPRWTGPAQFVVEGDEFTKEHHLRPVGLMSSPRLSYRK